MANVLREVLDSEVDSEVDREQDDFSSDDNIQNISSDSSNDDEDPGRRSVIHVDNQETETNPSVISSSVSELTE